MTKRFNKSSTRPVINSDSPPPGYSFDAPAYRIVDVITTRKRPGKLPLGRTALYAAAKRGEIEIVKYGKSSIVYADAIARFLHNLRQQQAA